MMKTLKRGLSLVLVLIMVVGLLPVTAFAAVDSSGRPKDVNNSLVLSIYTGSGFPGEPAVYGTSNYKNFNSNFTVRSGSTFANSANNQLDWNKIDKDIVQGTPSGNTSVWGVYDASGTKDYFKSDASIIQPANEAKMIRAIKTEMNGKSDDEVLSKYEIVWYVIKLQHSSSGWRNTTEWHIDGVIKERELVSINYYGNGNTSGSAPLGTTNHPAGEPYTVLDHNGMKKEIRGVEVAFLGWSAKADGTGEEAGFYQPGDEIPADVLAKHGNKISLYAMWDTTTQYKATVRTYLDNELASDNELHGEDRELYLSTDDVHFYALTEGDTGIYTAQITGNGKFRLYEKNADGTYTQVGNHLLTIYNQDGILDIHHYSVSYDPNGGEFAVAPGLRAYNHGDAVNAISAVPRKEGYRFLGWKTESGGLIAPEGEVTSSITAPITLVAQWEKTVNVTVNVTINHVGGDGYDQMDTKDDVIMALVARADSKAPYLETGDTLELSMESHEGFEYSETGNVTRYTANGAAFTDMPGGTVEYTVVTSKSGYDTSITATKDKKGDWTIDVVMEFKPENFDFEFTVEVDEDVLDHYVPDAVIAKVTFWSSDDNEWKIITQQEGGSPGVRVDIDKENRTGFGKYPVWMYESGTNIPYGYRIEITSFVYPDGTIVRASDVLEEDVQWSDNVYTATVQEIEDGKQYGTLNGAYYSDATKAQAGTVNAVVTMQLNKVTFDAQGGKVNGLDRQEVADQYKIPGFSGYVPTREGGYTFAGWYLEADCINAATEGADLDEDIILYAKWIDPLTVSGTVTIAGSYDQNGEKISVNDIDRATEAVVVLQEIRNNSAFDVDSMTVKFGTYEDDDFGSADYSFAGIPNDGKQYQIHVLVLNYKTLYDNENDDDLKFTANEYKAVFNGDDVADVDAYLEFVPPSYKQELNVDASQIAKDYRPDEVLSEVLYRDTGDNHAYRRISQHNAAPYGVVIDLNRDGIGEGSQSIWKWHTDATLYEYQMNVSEVDGVAFDSDTAPFHIVYDAPAYWSTSTDAPSGELKATLIPNKYLVTFNLNAGDDIVTGMDDYTVTVNNEQTDGEDAGTTVVYQTEHTWSFDTTINATPVREGYTFEGWTADSENVYKDGKIGAAVHQDVVLTAQWQAITYEVKLEAEPEEGGTVTGAGTYNHGTDVTIVAEPAEGYAFDGWYENGERISRESSYTFEILNNCEFTAKFSLVNYEVTTRAYPSDGGTTTGGGEYAHGTKATLTATPNTGYRFVGWYKDSIGDTAASEELSFDVTVTEDLVYVAKFEINRYTVKTTADPTEGGTTTGDGTFDHGTEVTVKADVETGYSFDGWYINNEKISDTVEYRFEVTGNCELTAKFVKTVYQVTALAEHGGEANGTATYYYGDTATVEAIVDETFNFDGWYEGNAKVSSDLEYTFTVTSDRTLTAKFVKNGYNVTTTATDGGTTEGSGYYDEGDTATVVAIAKEGYMFTGWYEGENLVSDKASYSFVVTSDRTLKATFSKAHTITTIAQTGGSASGDGTYVPMATATIKATANDGYYFVGWYDEKGELVTAKREYSLTVTENRTFTAKFEEKVSYNCDYVYIFGYEDTQIGAEGPLLRGELAQMIYRLVKQNTGAGHGNHQFTDTAGEWFMTGISYMTTKGAINGNKANAYPYSQVTRGETYKMICLGLGFTTDTNLRMSDYADILRNSGFITGDGSMTSRISRWQFCELFNAIIGRTNAPLVDEDGNAVTAETYNYTDLIEGSYYYEIMLRATSAYKNGVVDLKGRAERNVLDEYAG